ncbi:hypothetical protein KXV85_004626, partial [Aspergillus fumigatus]
HRRYADWTPERIQRRANEIGPKTSALTEIILRERTHPEQGFRATIGILRHATGFGHERLEAACARALETGASSYTSVISILKTNLDRRRPDPATDGPAILRALRLDGMADAFVELQSQDRAKDLSPAEWLALMLDREATHRGTQR